MDEIKSTLKKIKNLMKAVREKEDRSVRFRKQIKKRAIMCRETIN